MQDRILEILINLQEDISQIKHKIIEHGIDEFLYENEMKEFKKEVIDLLHRKSTFKTENPKTIDNKHLPSLDNIC